MRKGIRQALCALLKNLFGNCCVSPIGYRLIILKLAGETDINDHEHQGIISCVFRFYANGAGGL